MPVCELAGDSDVHSATAERGQNADIYTVNLVICQSKWLIGAMILSNNDPHKKSHDSSRCFGGIFLVERYELD